MNWSSGCSWKFQSSRKKFSFWVLEYLLLWVKKIYAAVRTWSQGWESRWMSKNLPTICAGIQAWRQLKFTRGIKTLRLKCFVWSMTDEASSKRRIVSEVMLTSLVTCPCMMQKIPLSHFNKHWSHIIVDHHFKSQRVKEKVSACSDLFLPPFPLQTRHLLRCKTATPEGNDNRHHSGNIPRDVFPVSHTPANTHKTKG